MTRITARLLVAYAAAILAALNAFGAILYAHPSIFLFGLAFTVALPLGREVLADNGLDFSTPAAAIIYAVATFVGNIWFVVALLRSAT